MLTRKQNQLLNIIHERLLESGVSPSFEEMKDALGLASKSGVHRLIAGLEERGFIRRLPNRARALEVVKMPDRGGSVRPITSATTVNLASAPMARALTPANDVVDIPLHGRIAAGTPIEALEGHNLMSVPAALLGTGEHYALEVAGDSMVEAGILDGDFALIRKAQSARNGEIVVALVDDHEATLKFFRTEGSMVRLDPANRAYEAMRYSPNQIKIQGTLAGLLRRY